MRRWSGHLVVTVVLALLLGATPLPTATIPTTSAAADQRVSNANGAVVWEVHEDTKEIVVTVKLAFSVARSRGTPTGEFNSNLDEAACKLLGKCDGQRFDITLDRNPRPDQQHAVERAIQRISNSITAAWDQQSFGCYLLRVKLLTRFVQDPAQVGNDEVHVTLDDSTIINPESGKIEYRYFAFVQTKGEKDYRSDEPDARGDPVTGPSGESRWPLAGAPDNYQHEFGHVLGLDDSYEGNNLRKGAVEDIMFNQRDLKLSWKSVARAVRRSGLDVDRLSCAMQYVLPTSLIAPWAPGNTLSVDVILCKLPLPSADPRTRRTSPEQPFSGSLTGSVDLEALSNGQQVRGGPISGTYTVSIESEEIWTFNIRLSSGISLRQRAKVKGAHLVAVGSPSFPEGGIFGYIFGPTPRFDRLVGDPEECR